VAHDDLLAGLVQLHVLHHAVHQEIFGVGMLAELRRHGYRIGPSTLYPMLHRMVERGYLKVREVPDGRTRRRMYRATARGRRALLAIRHHVRELFGELVEET
jgi:DNA-binding PadR family transcriptional regulator